MKSLIVATAMLLAACSPVATETWTVYADAPYEIAEIDAAWADACNCLRMDGTEPWVYIKPMPIDPEFPNATGVHASGRVLVEPSLYSLRHEFVHELLEQNTGDPGREDYESSDPNGCFRVSWR